MTGSEPRTVLIEFFTAGWCVNCPAAAAAIDSLVAVYGQDSLAVLEYHLTQQDPLGIPQSDARQSFYAISGIPTSVFGGTEIETGALADVFIRYRSRVVEQWSSRSPVRFDLAGSIAFDTLRGQLTIVAVDSIPFDTLELRCAVFEDSIYYPAANGETIHTYVVRNFISLGVVTVSIDLARGDTLSRTCTFTIPSGWDKNRLGLVSFLQDPQSGSVVQARSVRLGAANYDFSLVVPDTVKTSQLDNSTLFPFIVTNTGLSADTITLDLPDSTKTMPAAWSVSICDTLTCYPTPLRLFLLPRQSASTFHIDVLPTQTTGSGSVILVAASAGNPNNAKKQKLTVQVP